MPTLNEFLEKALQDLKIVEKYTENLNEANLTKKHFIALAAMMKKAKTLDQLKNSLLVWVKELNPNFDEERFKKASGIKGK